VAEGKVFVGTLDGRLVALDAKTGATIWNVQTTDRAQPYTITGAPRVAGDFVLIGNGGGEFGVRGYVTAYDTETGKQAWRFYTVPGDPVKGPDGAASDPQMAMAAKTWAGKWYEYGGGGTAWDAIVYDREFDQILVGTGNGSPWNHRIRSDGKGDNLFLSSIVALDARTGTYKWHFQETPAESWDFTATQPIVLATLRIAGTERKVAMQAPKNGFFYVIDRKDGSLISAKNFVPVNWATSIDSRTGRPIETAEARYYRTGKPFAAVPAFLGAHNWHPMAYSPKTGLVYIPTQKIPYGYGDQRPFAFRPGDYNTGTIPIASDDTESNRSTGEIVAWDPVKQEAAWRLAQPWPGNGGMLATGGNLLFQGGPDGSFNAYDARDGRKLWSANAGAGVIAAASTYLLDGEQYVAVVAGLGGSSALFAGLLPRPKQLPNGRLLVFKFGGKSKLPEGPVLDPPPNPPTSIADAGAVKQGAMAYAFNCIFCHGKEAAATAILPDLRRSPALSDAAMWKDIVHDGALEATGMIGFGNKLTPGQVEAIRLYVGERARKLRQESSAGK